VNPEIRPDLCIIGAGAGGLSVAAGAAQMGARVVLVERGRMGGDCLNYGCVPSKALLAAAHIAHGRGLGAEFGIAPARAEVDFAAVMDHVQGVIAAIAPHDSVERFEALGVRVIRAEARFAGPDIVEAGGQRIRARRFVIATGSAPLIPPIDGLDTVPYLTNETLFDLDERPAHLMVLGGGPIGIEMAQAFARLGSRVTVIEALAALGREDAEAAALVLDRLRAEGVAIHERSPVARVSGAAGAITLQGEDGQSWTGSHLLVAAGRRPQIRALDLDAAGVAHDARGVIVDAGLRSSNRRVYAIGDVARGPQFTHLAGYHAGLVLRSALFRLPVRAGTAHIPRVTYTDPELAQIGPTEAEARALHGARLEVLRQDYAGNDRAQAERRTEGFVKLMVRRGRPVGATIVGAAAGELIGQWALAIPAGLKVGAVAGMVAPYPTLGELNKRAAGQYYVPRLFESGLVRRAVRLLVRL